MNDRGNFRPMILLGLFRELVANGVPIGVRDYLDGLRVLQLGYGQGDRQHLIELVQILWARSDEERRIILRWFEAIPLPSVELVAEIDKIFDEIDEIRSKTDTKILPGQKENVQRSSVHEINKPELRDHNDKVTQTDTSSARVSFGSTHDGKGLPLPRLLENPDIQEEYLLSTQALVSSRDMTVLWRRYRRATRHGPRTELDITATIHERCRSGFLLQPVFRPQRSNNARLLVLADSSPSMAPWLSFLSNLADSLELGRMARAEIRYFNNLPRKQLYINSDLIDAEPLEEVFRRFSGYSLLLVSDGGSARGLLNRRRAVLTNQFLIDATQFFGSSIVWINPMPESRWANTTAALISQNNCMTSLPLDSAHLLRAVDILRGNK